MSATQESPPQSLVPNDNRIEQAIADNIYCISTSHMRGSPDPRIRRAEVTQLYEATIQEASVITGTIRERALHEPGLVSRVAFTRSVRLLVFRINEILRYGPLVGGGELAWKATLHLAECCIVRPDSSMKVVGEENDCSDHHDRLDRRMLDIAKLQQKCGKVSVNGSQKVMAD